LAVPYRPYPPALASLVVRDPVVDLPADHLARLVDQVVDAVVQPPLRPPGSGQPPYNPRLCLKVLVYGYATGVRSSRRLEQLCDESLPYLLLTRGDTPSYHTLCTARLEQAEAMEQVFQALFTLAAGWGMKRLGHVVVDATKLRADASPEAVLTAKEFEVVRQELARVLQEAATLDERENREGTRSALRLGQTVDPDQMRDIVRRLRKARRLLARKHDDEGQEQAAASAAGATAGAERKPTRAEKRGSLARERPGGG
jgi:transposase